MTGSDNWPDKPQEEQEHIDPLQHRIELYQLLYNKVTKGYDGGDLYDLSHAVETMRLLLSDLEWLQQERHADRKWWKLWMK